MQELKLTPRSLLNTNMNREEECLVKSKIINIDLDLVRIRCRKADNVFTVVEPFLESALYLITNAHSSVFSRLRHLVNMIG